MVTKGPSYALKKLVVGSRTCTHGHGDGKTGSVEVDTCWGRYISWRLMQRIGAHVTARPHPPFCAFRLRVWK